MQPFSALELASVAEVSGIAETRNDVFVLVQSLIDGCTPDGSLILRESLLDVLDSFWSGKHAGYVDMLRGSLGKERLHTHLHADTCGKHRVCDDERLAGKVWSSQILDMNPHLGMLLVGIFAIGTHESIAGVVEDIEETLVERQASTEDRTDDNLVGREINLGYTERGSHVSVLVIEGL